MAYLEAGVSECVYVRAHTFSAVHDLSWTL